MAKESYSREVIREVINNNFTFADLSKRFEGVDSSTGNIYCPFHDNHDTPAAKMYWDDERNIWIIHCFGECHRNFTAYDYVDLILCNKYGNYVSPLYFLKARMPQSLLGMQLELSQKRINEFTTTALEERKNYIDNLYIESGDLVTFIERLYTA